LYRKGDEKTPLSTRKNKKANLPAHRPQRKKNMQKGNLDILIHVRKKSSGSAKTSVKKKRIGSKRNNTTYEKDGNKRGVLIALQKEGDCGIRKRPRRVFLEPAVIGGGKEKRKGKIPIGVDKSGKEGKIHKVTNQTGPEKKGGGVGGKGVRGKKLGKPGVFRGVGQKSLSQSVKKKRTEGAEHYLLRVTREEVGGTLSALGQHFHFVSERSMGGNG